MHSNRFEIFSSSITQLVKSVQYVKSHKVAEHGLKGSNAVCLCEVYDSKDGLTATELARKGAIDKAQVSRCMAELTAAGLVLRDDENGHRYKRKYCLTEKGRAVAEDIDKTAKLVQQAINKNISEQDLDTFFNVLYTLCGNFEELIENDKK